MGLSDLTLSKAALGFVLAGSLIRELHRRGGRAKLDVPDAAFDTGPSSAAETAERAAWNRFVVALEKLNAVQAAYELEPDDLAAESVRWAEVDLEDAVAVAGEFEVQQSRWLLT